VANIYTNVIGPGLKYDAKKANSAFMDIMIEIRKMPAPFSAEASAAALGAEVLDNAAVTMDATKTKNHATVLLAFLLSESYEDALWHHLRLKIDFVGLILRNSFTNINKQCLFVWKDAKEAYLLDDEIKPQHIQGICGNINKLIDGAYKSRTKSSGNSKPEEYRMRRVLLEGVKGNVDLVSRNLMIEK
jgi:hypothetical protein